MRACTYFIFHSSLCRPSRDEFSLLVKDSTVRQSSRADSQSIMLARSIVRAASTSANASTSSVSSSSSTLAAYLLLSRPPTILRSPTSFESAYYAYNSKLQRALSQPFPREIYFKKGSAAENKFLKEEEDRTKSLLSSNQIESIERESSSSTSSTKEESRSVEVEVSEIEGQDLYRTNSRRTKADEENQLDSLERNLDRSLFLLVRGGEMGNDWTLPFTRIERKGSNTSLHKAAPQIAHSIFGKQMDIWMVSNLPIGLISKDDQKSSSGGGGKEKVYVMSGHILAGQPDKSVTKGAVDFAWLTKEEIRERVTKDYWSEMEDLLST